MFRKMFLALMSVAGLAAILAPSLSAQTPFTASGGLPATITNTAASTATFNVTGLTGNVTDVSLSMDLAHTWVGDVTITLTDPQANTFTIFERPGNPATTFGFNTELGTSVGTVPATYNFIDGGASFETAAATNPIAPGSYTAENATGVPQSFATFFGGLTPAQANGTWTITFTDSVGGDDGTCSAATLTITQNATPTAPTITSTAPTTGFATSMYTYTVTASGNPAPTFSISPDPATLGSGWLTWDGTDTLSGTPAAGDVGTYGPFTITATNGVNPDATEVFSVTISPAAPEIDIQDPNATAVASGSTVGVYAAIVATASTGNFNIDNNGNVTLNITSTTTTNMVNCTTSNTGPGATIAAAGSDTLAISVTPTAAGAFSFTVTIVNDDPDEGSYVLNFAGEAKAAADNEIVVLNPTGGDIANGGTLSENNTGTLAFNRAFTVRNIGGNTLTLSGGPIAISALNNCTVTPNQPASSTLAGAGTWLPTDEAFTLDITPTAAGAFSFLVTIGNDDADEAPFTFTFSGNTAGGGSGGGGGGGNSSCSTDSSNGLSIFALLGILSMLAISIRVRGSKA